MPPQEVKDTITPYGLLRELQDRVSLEIPLKILKEEQVAENYDGLSARYTIVWTKQPKYDVEKIVKSLANQVLKDQINVTYTISSASHSRETSSLLITVDYTKEAKAALHAANGPVPALKVPLSIEFQENAYRIESDDGGETFSIIRNGDPIEKDCKSVAAALGLLQKHLLVDLSYIEDFRTEEPLNDMDKDFLEAISGFMYQSPALSPDAKEALTKLVELLTNHIFEPELAGKKT